MRSEFHDGGSEPLMPVFCTAMYLRAVSEPQLCGSVPVMLGLPPKDMRVTMTWDATVTVTGTAGRVPASPELGRDTVTEVESHVT